MSQRAPHGAHSLGEFAGSTRIKLTIEESPDFGRMGTALDSAVRAGRPPRAPKVRILRVDPAAVELQGMALADEELRARVARLDDLGVAQETPEYTAGDREWAVCFWLEGAIDRTVRLRTGAWEGRMVGEKRREEEAGSARSGPCENGPTSERHG